MSVHEPPPAGRSWKGTAATPGPEPSSAEAETGMLGPPTTEPPVGAVSAPVGAVLSTSEARTGLVPTLPEPSVATARRSMPPSATAVVSKLTENGALVSVEIVVQVSAPAGLRWKATWAVSADELALSVTEPRMFAPGSSSVTSGATLSTVIVRVDDVTTLPARSVATASRSAGPSGAVVESQETEYGAVVSVPTVVKDEEPLAFTRNCTKATPAVASLAFAPIATLPEMVWPSAGAVSEADGAVLSTTLPVRVETDWLVAPSRKTA